ncbi:MAG: hypothetical protein LBF97_00960 [Elusimicrobiota bacterium]|jgi:hypothetical protein|nr:hypothetical protein [Elusimicrobiota bacterium]
MTQIDEYKGNKVLTIKRDENDKYTFSFGVQKAKLIIENLEDIKNFIAENDKKTTP